MTCLIRELAMNDRKILQHHSPVAGGGLLSRRNFLTRSTGAGALFLPMSFAAAGSFEKAPDSWSKAGADFSNYGLPPSTRAHPIRWISNHPAVPGEGVSWTPLHQLQGSITPNGLHFERHHNGIPEVDAENWELAIHGKIKRPSAFSLNDLHRLPLHTQTLFIECGGNSNAMWRQRPVQTAAGYIHGLLSCAEWTGVRLSTLLDSVGFDTTDRSTQSKWIIADGLDSSGVTVSIPLEKALDDVMIALYQNGEPVRPSQGYPARLVVPGWEGITHVKWLRSLMLTDKPLMSKYDTVSYTDLMRDGKFNRFSFEMGVKSFITEPSPGFELTQQGVFEIRGIAWSGSGSIKRVEVSADGGKSWADAELQSPVIEKSITRFRIPWLWSGQSSQLLSRATDQHNNLQPTRTELINQQGANAYYHYNGTTMWAIDGGGKVRHEYS